MAQSGRSLSDSAARPGRNEVTIKVTLLDGEDKSFSIDRRDTAETIISRVITEFLAIEEKEYFSLYYLENNHRLFLDPRKQIKRLMPNASARQWDLYFGVKFYVHSPDILKQDLTRYLYVLQICIDIRENRILVDGDDASHLASLLLQANVGDYSLAEHRAGYSLDFLKLLYSNVDQLPSRYELSLIELHKQHLGLNPEQAEMKFLQKAKDLRRYGQHLFAVYGNDGTVVHVGVSCTGIAIHHGNRQVEEHVWPNIVKVSYRKRKFRIKYREAHNNTADSSSRNVLLVEFRCGEPPASKRLWKACVEQHTFFRLSHPEPPPRRPSLLLRRGSKFRYSSGRTLEQMRQATYEPKDQSIHRTYSARYGKDADRRSRTNVHCYTVSKSIGEDSWQLDQTNQYTMAVDKEVKRRQLAGNFNQQKMFALVKLDGAEMPASSAQASNAQKKFVIRRSDVSGKYELELNKAPPPSDSTRQLSSWNEAASASLPITLQAAQPSNGVSISRSHEEERPLLALITESSHIHSTSAANAASIFYSHESSPPPYEAKEKSPSEDDDITPELAKLDEMMISIQKEMDTDNSLAATVVTAFLKKEHTLVHQNAGGYPSIIQEVQ